MGESHPQATLEAATLCFLITPPLPFDFAPFGKLPSTKLRVFNRAGGWVLLNPILGVSVILYSFKDH